MKKYDYTNSDVRTWLEIDKKRLNHNYNEFRGIIGKNCRLMAVVKSNAYGHGLIDYSKALDKFGVDWFGVDSFVEVIKLRKAGIQKPILVLGYTLPNNFLEAAKLNISLTVSSLEQVQKLKKIPHQVRDDTNIKTHLKIDTGMHRQGFQLDELPEVLKVIKNTKNIEIEGVYSHFADVESPKCTNAKNQLEKFEKANQIIRSIRDTHLHLRGGGDGLIRHMAATAGTIALSKSHFDMVRVGIGLMGLWPSESIEKTYSNKIKLQPIMSWKTIIAEIKSVKKYEKIGYGFTETLKRDSKIAILPIGYWHGYRRALSSKGFVLIHGTRCKVLGRVAMDMTVVDVTELKSVCVGDTVTLIGRDLNEEITVEEMAGLAGSYKYEIITTINPLIQKIYR